MPAVLKHEPGRAEIEAWRVRHEAGESLRAISRSVGISKSSLLRRVHGQVSPKITAEDVARWAHAYKHRHSLPRIARENGFDYETVRLRLIKAGVKMRRSGGRRKIRTVPVTGAQIVEWRRLYTEEGWSLQDIAIYAGRPKATVRSHLLDVLRPAGRPVDVERMRRMVEARASAPYGTGPELAERFGYTAASWDTRLNIARKYLASLGEVAAE